MRRHVLVVDDDREVRESIAELLELEGFTVSVARDGLDALDQLRSGAEKPSLILLDLMMPHMTGWELLEHLQADLALRSIPVCIVSASGASAPQAAHDALPKPFNAEALLKLVGKYTVADRETPPEPSRERRPGEEPE